MRKPKGKYRYPLYEVRWLDAEGDAGWTEPDKKIEPVPVINIGFFIAEDEEYVKIAAAYVDKIDDLQVSSTDIIPKRMITSMTELKVSKPKAKKTSTGSSKDPHPAKPHQSDAASRGGAASGS